MLSYEFKTYIANGSERYAFVEQGLDNAAMTTKSSPFPESLLSLVYLDIDQLKPLFDEMGIALTKLLETREAQYADEIYAALRVLPLHHVYFELLRLDWKYRLDRARALGFEFAGNLLQRRELYVLPDDLRIMQGQIKELFAHVLDIDSEKTSAPDRMTAYYKSAGDGAFRFRPQPMGFELVYGKDFAEVLYPNSVYDLIDYQLRECVKREIKMRVCKNCGRWFAVTGHTGTEYCDRPFDEKGRTCKEMGAIAVWAKNKSDDQVFKAYRREYKKRFAWIKAGKIEQADFYAWSRQAREKKTACDNGKLTLEAFTDWLAKT